MAKRKEFDIDEVEPEYRKCQLPKTGNNVITCLARMSYPHLQKLRPLRKGDAPDKKRKYSIELLIPPDFSMRLLEKDVARATEEKFGDNPPKKLKSPFLEAGDFDKEGYEKGWTLIRANSDSKPGVVDGLEGIKITEEDDPAIYAGRWCVATLRAYYYEVDGNRGISLGLGNVRLLHHDDAIGGGRTRVEDEFDVAEDYADIKKGKKKAFEEDEDDEDDRPRKAAPKRKAARDDDDEDEAPRRSGTKRRVVEDDEDDEPRRPAKKPARRVVDEDEEDERPARRPAKRRGRDDDDLD